MSQDREKYQDEFVSINHSSKPCPPPDCEGKGKIPLDRAFCVSFDLCVEASISDFEIIDLGPCPDLDC